MLEKKTLNEINGNKLKTLRFPIKGKIKTKENKISW